MNKIKQIIIGTSMIFLSGNAAAMMVYSNGPKVSNFKVAVPIMQDLLVNWENTNLSAKKKAKLDLKFEKYFRVSAARVEARDVDVKEYRHLGEQKRNVKRFIRKKYKNIVASTGSSSNLKTNVDYGDMPSENVPEPSTIALLGLGLVGIGAARRLRKKAS